MIPERAAGMPKDDWEDEWWNDCMADDFRECEGCGRMWHREDVTKDEVGKYWCDDDACQEWLAEDRRARDWFQYQEKHERPGIDF